MRGRVLPEGTRAYLEFASALGDVVGNVRNRWKGANQDVFNYLTGQGGLIGCHSVTMADVRYPGQDSTLSVQIGRLVHENVGIL